MIIVVIARTIALLFIINVDVDVDVDVVVSKSAPPSLPQKPLVLRKVMGILSQIYHHYDWPLRQVCRIWYDQDIPV